MNNIQKELKIKRSKPINWKSSENVHLEYWNILKKIFYLN